MSREQAQALTRTVHLLRPAWNEGGIYAALAQVKDRDSFEVALAALRAAQDPKALTPGVIPAAGPHWNEAPPKEPTKATYRPPRKTEDCRTHPGNYADACRGCAADALAGDRTTPGDPRRPDRAGHVAELRRIHGVVKSQTCRHGLDRTRAKCAQCDRKPEPAPEAEPAATKETT